MGDLLFTMTKKETKDSLVFLNKKYAHFKDDEIVEVRIAGTRAQIKSSGFKTPKGHMSIQRKGDDLINTNTGEVIQYKKYNKRIDNIKGIRKSLDDLYWLIAANVHGRKNELFLTLTYEEPYQFDPKQAKKDWRNFYKNHLHRDYPNVRYIAIFEPQGRLYYDRKGNKVPSWHIHVILLGIGSIPKEKLHRWWKKGNISFINIGVMKEQKGINNLSEYFTSYATKLDADHMNPMAIRTLKEMENKLQSDDKTEAKASRLYFYPANFRIYTSSEGLNKPITMYMRYNEVNETTLGTKVNESTTIVQDAKGKKVNEYKREIFERS